MITAAAQADCIWSPQGKWRYSGERGCLREGWGRRGSFTLQLFEKKELGDDHHHAWPPISLSSVDLRRPSSQRRTWMLALWLGMPEDNEMSTGTQGR